MGTLRGAEDIIRGHEHPGPALTGHGQALSTESKTWAGSPLCIPGGWGQLSANLC